ncbi:response regulator [Sphingobacterium prati]|uniref:response regulator n=1 Tax=Sphingobacterium prati TaxID=2737006 RepID=UPI0015520ABD|nr:response regulator [Sphingobacterium prati]NPE46673.1 response regulator [Sphingobacterium prati]
MENKIKLVFADDSKLQQKIIALLSKQFDLFDLQFLANNGNELLQYLDSCEVLPQACILDLHMPVMNGISAAGEVSRRFPTINIFGYTATESLIEIHDFRRSGAVQVFSKCNPEYMLQVIGSYDKKGRQYNSPSIVKKNISITQHDTSQ